MQITAEQSDRLNSLLATTGIHQIAELPKAEWAYIKKLVRLGAAKVVDDFGFPRVTKRYFAVGAA